MPTPAMTFETLVFDLDGTLTDPLPGMAAAINHALSEHGLPTRSSAELAQYVGPPLEGTFVDLLQQSAEDSSRDLTNDPRVTTLIASYRESYLDEGYKQNAVYPGIRELLTSLSQQEFGLGVCTSKPEPIARRILEHFDVLDHFQFVSGGDVGVRKGDQLKDLLARQVIDLTALMIGDRSVDIVAAKENQLRSASVSWGYGSETELANASADYHLPAPAELLYLTGLEIRSA